MAKRIYVSDNYIIVDNEGDVKTFSMTHSEYDEADDQLTLRKYPNKANEVFGFSDIPNWSDEADAVAYSVATLRTFLRVNTGFNAASGGSGASVQVVTSSATVTPVAELSGKIVDDGVEITAQAEALTIAAPSGTPFRGQFMSIKVTDDGTTQTVAFNAVYVATESVTIPTDTIAGKSFKAFLGWNVEDANWSVYNVAHEV